MRFDGVKPNFVEGDGQALLVFCDILSVNEGAAIVRWRRRAGRYANKSSSIP